MDFQNQTPQRPVFVRSSIPGENSMATAAMVVGIIGGLSTFLLPFYLPCILGGISMVLAFLSKGSSSRLSARAKAGFITSLCSISINICILAGCFYLIFNVPEFQEAFDEAYEQLYGESFYDSLEDPFSNDPNFEEPFFEEPFFRE